jgi:hypothetical protein
MIRVIVGRISEEEKVASARYRCFGSVGIDAGQQQIAIALTESLPLCYVDLRSSFSTPIRGGLLDCDDLGRYGE